MFKPSKNKIRNLAFNGRMFGWIYNERQMEFSTSIGYCHCIPSFASDLQSDIISFNYANTRNK